MASEKTLHAIFQAVDEALFLIDHQGKILTCNHGAAKRLRHEAKELIGLTLSDCLAVAPADADARSAAAVAEALHSGAPVRLTAERSDALWDLTVNPVSEDGRVTGAVVSIRDVTAHQQAEGDQHEHRGSLPDVERLASLGMISATLAHELAQPLSVVRLATQNAASELERLDCPAVVRQDLQDSLAACARIIGMVTRFRDMARRPGKPREVEVRIPHVAGMVFRLLEQSARQARMKMSAENLDTLPAIRMRENDLDQLFFALAQNAVQAADGKKDCHLVITGTWQDNAVTLQFRDNCGGIAPEHLPRIFEPFFTTKPSGRGTGLGRCIAHRIVRHRGGQISVESQWAKGTTFTVTLPRELPPEGRYLR